MIEYYKKIAKNKSLEKSSEYHKDSWINVIDPTEDEISFLVEKFNLERDLIIDGLDVYEIPRIEEENNCAYLFFRIPTSKISHEYTASFLLIISKDLFITVSNSKLEVFEKIIMTKKDFFTNKRTRSLLQILLFLSNRFNNKIRAILKEVRMNRRYIEKLNEKDIRDLVLKEDMLNDYLNSFDPLLNMHSMMLKLKSIRFEEDERDFIEDIIVDLNQTLITCKTSLKSITNMRDYYSTALSHNLNKILSLLTLFTIFLTIPTVISSIYGMNIGLPLQDDHRVFWYLSGLVVIIWGLVILMFKRYRLL